jgi:hypothetical protein
VLHSFRHRGARLALACSCSVAAAAITAPVASAGRSTLEALRDRPKTTITKAPKRKTSQRRARFAFSSDGSGVSFQCRLDGASLSPCDSPATFRRLEPGRHALRVRAVDAAGNVDATPAVHRWKVVGAYDPEQDVEGNDLPPPPGSPAAQFEQECAAHPVICT